MFFDVWYQKQVICINFRDRVSNLDIVVNCICTPVWRGDYHAKTSMLFRLYCQIRCWTSASPCSIRATLQRPAASWRGPRGRPLQDTQGTAQWNLTCVQWMLENMHTAWRRARLASTHRDSKTLQHGAR